VVGRVRTGWQTQRDVEQPGEHPGYRIVDHKSFRNGAYWHRVTRQGIATRPFGRSRTPGYP
jgi:hypothetical protein